MEKNDMIKKVCLSKIEFYLSPLLFFCVLQTLMIYGTCHAEEDKKKSHILYINSYHPGYNWSDGIEAGLSEQFKISGKKIELSIEYLDSVRFPDKNLQAKNAALIQEKYKGHRLDLVIVSDNAAFDFAIKNREFIFPDIPIVFCGYNNFHSDVLTGLNNITGVNEENNIMGGIDTALSVQPNIETLVFVLSTKSLTRKNLAIETENVIIPKYREQYNIIVLKDVSTTRIRETLSNVSRESALFLFGLTRDKEKELILNPVENARLITYASPIPAYTLWDFHIGMGALGGRIISSHDQGRVAGDMALQILNGKNANDIPVLMESPTKLIFDYTVMKRFDIKIEDLPAGSEIINQPHSFYEINKSIVWTAIAGFALLITFIVTLSLIIIQKKRVEKELKDHRDNLEIKVKKRTADLTEAQKLARVGHYVFDLKSGYWSSSSELDKIFGTPEDFKKDIKGWRQIVHPDHRDEMMEYLSNQVFGKHQKFNKEYKIINIADQKEYWVHGRGELKFDADGNILELLGTIQDITERKQMDQELRESQQNMASILNNTQDAIVRIDKNFRHIFANPSFYRATGLSAEQYIGKTNRESGMSEALCSFFQRHNEKVFQSGETVTAEYSFLTKNYGELQLQAVISPEFNENKEVETIITIVRDITGLKQAESEKNATIAKLEKTLAEVNTLRGLIPICAKCKKIRDDKGYWNTLESYIEKYSDASFSHGICQECSDALYGNESWYKKKKNPI